MVNNLRPNYNRNMDYRHFENKNRYFNNNTNIRRNDVTIAR